MVVGWVGGGGLKHFYGQPIGLSYQKQNIDFQNGGHGRHLGSPIGTILAIFDVQVTPILPTNFQVDWPFSSREEA